MFWIHKHLTKYHIQNQNKTCLTCSKSSSSSQSICLISNLWGRVSDFSLCSDDNALEVSDPQVSLLQVTPSQSFALSATLSATFKQFKLETYQEQKNKSPTHLNFTSATPNLCNINVYCTQSTVTDPHSKCSLFSNEHWLILQSVSKTTSSVCQERKTAALVYPYHVKRNRKGIWHFNTALIILVH